MISSHIAKIVVQVKLTPDAIQASVLERTLSATNEAANQVSAAAFEHFELRARETPLRKLCYCELKACRRCGFAGHADVVAGINVRNRARSAWVFGNMPDPPA